MTNKYTAEDVEKRTSDLVCFKCGRMFLSEKQLKSEGGVVSAQSGVCGLCGSETTVTNIRAFNWLQIKDYRPRDGFRNRHVDGLPEVPTLMEIINGHSDGETLFICEWKPFDITKYTGKVMRDSSHIWTDMPGEGYLGTVTVVDGKYKGIGFHAWEQNNSEFIYYRLK